MSAAFKPTTKNGSEIENGDIRWNRCPQIDELQDVQSEALPVIEETMSHSTYREMLLVETASEGGSEFERIWQISDMREWDPRTSTWIPRRPENRAYSGYHLSQGMASWITELPQDDPNSIVSKRNRYSERRFMNEVLGLFYRGLAKSLLDEDLLRCSDTKNQ